MSIRLSRSSPAILRSLSSPMGPYLAQLLGGLTTRVVVDLNDLKLGLGDLPAARGFGSDQLSALTLKARRVALKGDHTGEWDQLLFPKRHHTFELLVDQGDLAAFGFNLLFKATDFFPELVGTLAKLRFLPASRLHPQVEELALVRQDMRDGALHVFAGQQIVGEANGVGGILLGLEARLLGMQFVQAVAVYVNVGLRLGVVEAHQDLAGLHAVIVVDIDLGDHTAGGVLHSLCVRVDDHDAGRDHRACEIGAPRPPRESADKDDHHQ